MRIPIFVALVIAFIGLSVLSAGLLFGITVYVARDTVIEQVRDTGVPAIFGSEVFPSPIMEQIAKEGGAEFVDQLRDDDLPGAPGDPRHSYLGLMLSDIEIMVPALGGNVDAMVGFDPGPVFDGESGAVYPQ